MKNYIVYFEVFGKKMKTKVLAENVGDARQKVLDKVKFYKVEEDTQDDFNDIIDMMEDTVGYLSKLAHYKEKNNIKDKE
jgi:hypothetical protein